MNIDKQIAIIKNIIPEIITNILKIYKQSFEINIKSDNSPVTEADLISNSIIINTIKKYFPDDMILSEETKDDIKRVEEEEVWIIDPLDGTKEFIKKNDEFSVNIAFVKNKEPLFGFVIFPAFNFYYFAKKNQGAYFVDLKNNQIEQIKCSKVEKLEEAKLVISKSHKTKFEEEIIKNLKIKNFYEIGSALKICKIADGSADFYIRNAPLNEWDICAAHIILLEAGGYLTDFTNKEITYNNKITKISSGIICSNKILHNTILELLQN